MLFRSIILFVSLFLLAPGATPASPLHSVEKKNLTLTDATGKAVKLSLPAQRIVSLAPSVTEILFALGLESAIVGVTESCNFPEQVNKKQRIGNPIQPNVEVLLSLQPDLVLAVDGVTGSVGIEALRRVGLPVFTLKPRMIPSLLDEIRLIGRLTAREREAEELAGRIKESIEKVENKVRDREPVSVLYLIWHDPMMTAGPDTFIGEMIRRAGGEIMGSELGLGYFRLGMEAVLEADPEVIIIGDEIGRGNIEGQKEYWKRWSTIRAIQDGRIHFIPADLVHRPGPRISEGMAVFAELLHPGLFK
ncbi:MAG TPA: cobalamin-binding protein [Nitrospiria bacterium]